MGLGSHKELEHIPCAFGERAWVHIPEQARPRGKLAARGKMGIFIGMADQTRNCYRVQLETGEIVESKSCKFGKELYKERPFRAQWLDRPDRSIKEVQLEGREIREADGQNGEEEVGCSRCEGTKLHTRSYGLPRKVLARILFCR